MAMTDVSTLGEFEQVVLLAILRLGDDAYAVTVRDEILECTGRDVSRGSIYITLDRLETNLLGGDRITGTVQAAVAAAVA